jgi:hypothetical protein
MSKSEDSFGPLRILPLDDFPCVCVLWWKGKRKGREERWGFVRVGVSHCWGVGRMLRTAMLWSLGMMLRTVLVLWRVHNAADKLLELHSA